MSHEPATQFERETLALLAALRDNLRALVATLEGDPSSGTDLQRQLGLDMKLCWKLSRVLTAPDALAAAAFMPGPANMRDLLIEFGRRGAPAELLERTRNHAESFEALIRRHAGDRRTFDSMVSQWRGEETEKVDLEQRRAAFRANSHIWGIQADVAFTTSILRASREHPTLTDGVLLNGELGLRRIRRVPTAMFTKSVKMADYDGIVRREQRVFPLSPDGPPGLAFSLLRPFCSKNIPELVVNRHSDGSITVNLQQDAIGRAGSMDVVAGWVHRSFINHVPEENAGPGIFQVRMSSPWRAFVDDCFIEDGMFPGVEPRAAIYADRIAGESGDVVCGEVNLLSPDAGGAWLGRGISVAATPLIRNYGEMLRFAFKRAEEMIGGEPGSWDPQRFRLFRTVVHYPVMFSRLALIMEQR